MKTLRLVGAVVCLSLAAAYGAPALAQQSGDDPLSGTWVGDWGPSATDRNPVTLELKWDGKSLSGTVNPGANELKLQKATFDPKTSAVHFEVDAKSRSGDPVHFVVDGTVQGNKMGGSWGHDTRKGDFKISRKKA